MRIRVFGLFSAFKIRRILGNAENSAYRFSVFHYFKNMEIHISDLEIRRHFHANLRLIFELKEKEYTVTEEQTGWCSRKIWVGVGVRVWIQTVLM